MHLRNSQLCVLDAEGEVVEETSIRTDRGARTRWFRGRDRAVVVMEASGSSPWVSRLVAGLGHEVVVVNPRRVRLIAEARKKTDKVDAETLARLARADRRLVAPIQHRSEVSQRSRAVLRVRSALIGSRTKFINVVRGVLRSAGYRVGRGTTETFARRVREQAPHLPPELFTVVVPLVDPIETLTEAIAEHDEQVPGLVSDQDLMRRLQEVPGVEPCGGVVRAVPRGPQPVPTQP